MVHLIKGFAFCNAFGCIVSVDNENCVPCYLANEDERSCASLKAAIGRTFGSLELLATDDHLLIHFFNELAVFDEFVCRGNVFPSEDLIQDVRPNP